MRIKNHLLRCIWGATTVVLWCFAFVLPAKADICFLPTGICEQSAQTREADAKPCSYYTDNHIYYDSEQANMNCSLVNIPGCTLWDCTGKSCEEQGYHLGPTNSATTWPSGYSSSYWSCVYCQEGGKYKWKCSPKNCAAGYVQGDANCSAGYEWAPVAAYGKSGEEDCGECQQKVCPEGSSLTPTPGCQDCTVVEEFDDGRKCYKCHAMSAEFVSQAEKEANYDESCFKFTTKQASDTSICYRPEEIECGKDQYKEEKTINGKKMCKCYDYTYNFNLRNSSDHNLVFPANGISRQIPVVSERCAGSSCEFWDYTYAITSGNGQLKVQKLNGGTYLGISSPINKSQTTDLYYTIKLTQLWGDEATTRELVINVRVEHDTCPENAPQFSPTCATAGWKSKHEGTSVTGEQCFKCYNDNCNSGYTHYGVGGSCPTDGCYYSHNTDYGSTCCMAKPNNAPDSGYTDYGKNGTCPTNGNYYRHESEFCHIWCKAKPDDCPSSDYTKGATPQDGHNYDTTTTPFGSNCYKPKSDVCPGSQQKSCECGGTTGDKTPFGNQCYHCTPCCPVGDFGAHGQPGMWGSACQNDTDCQSGGDYPLICVNKNAYGCGECRECGTFSDCSDQNRRIQKYKDRDILRWLLLESNSGCDTYIGGHCMKKASSSASGCNVNSKKYPAYTRVNDTYQYNSDTPCWDIPDGSEAGECSAGGECLYGSTLPPAGDGWFDSVCYSDADCFESSDFPLYCFGGRCLECDKYSTCEALANDESRFKAKYGNVNTLTCSKKINGVRVRYAGETWTLEEYKQGYRERYYCTSTGECSQVNH